jgi:hypothetical protein
VIEDNYDEDPASQPATGAPTGGGFQLPEDDDSIINITPSKDKTISNNFTIEQKTSPLERHDPLANKVISEA